LSSESTQKTGVGEDTDRLVVLVGHDHRADSLVEQRPCRALDVFVRVDP